VTISILLIIENAFGHWRILNPSYAVLAELSSMTNANRVLFNTVALYVRVVITAILGLFSIRFVLAALGVVDYGLYSVIAGIMGFMAFLNGAMATSSQRHLTHELGRGDPVHLNRIFRTCFFLHTALAVLLVVLGETVGLWFLNHALNIPYARHEAGFWIYQFTVLSTAGCVIAVPYQALLTAHEALAVVSVIGIIQSILSFLLALFIAHAPGDRLIIYVLVSGIITILMTLTQISLCRVRYAEARISTENRLNRLLALELLGFSGWSLFGSLSVVGRLQGVAFLLNIFFGPAMNAAYGIANQVSNMMFQLTQAMQQAVSPRLVIQEGSGNRNRMLELSLLTSKYGFFLACFWMIPLFVEIQPVLTLWLKNPPEHSAAFCRIVLLMFICEQLSTGYNIAALAIGKIALYNIIIGGIHLATLPVAYAFLKLGFNQNSVLFCSLITMIIASGSRGLVVRRLADFPYTVWLNKVVFPGIAGILLAVLYVSLIANVLPSSMECLLLLSVTTGIVTMTGAFFIGMSRTERSQFKNLARALAPQTFGFIKHGQ
jgi:O-antigen/teichoic acid export membrane protein